MRGGYKPGGRPLPKVGPALKDIAAGAAAAKMQPLEYMIAVMNDPAADLTRRDRMAMAAAPYCHPRVADALKGKKDQQAEAAATAGTGTPWGDDLKFEGGRTN